MPLCSSRRRWAPTFRATRCRSMPTCRRSSSAFIFVPYADTPFNLEGNVALVTGAYRGLGFAIARGLARAGAHVVLNGRKRAELAAAVKKLTDEGLRADFTVFDVTDPDAVRASVAEIAVKHGAISILVNNAGIQR